MNFGKDIAELESIVEWFESGDVDLDLALEKFERGMELTERLKTHLETVENKVTVIKQKFANNVTKDTKSNKTKDPEDKHSKPQNIEDTNTNDSSLNLF